MKNKIKLFNLGVFLEALNQLKIVGIIASAIYLCAGILTPIGYMINEVYYDEDLKKWIPTEYGAENFLFLMVLVYVFIPIMMMVIFSWMNKRHSCDFYHALPIKRETMFVSTLAAVFAWVIIIMTIAVAVPLVIIASNVMLVVDMAQVGKSIIYIIVASIQMIGVFALGISLTGNGFTNVVASLMIMVVPRAILNIIILMASEFMPYVVMDYNVLLLSNIYNALLSPVMSMFSYSNNESLGLLGCTIYSVILGLTYATIACIMFKKRKSEVASQPSAYGIVQIICRMIPAFMFSLIGTYFLLEACLDWEFDISGIFVAIVWYTVALLAYFIYELITTRRWRKVGASVKQLPIFVGIVVVCGALVGVGSYAAMNREIDADRIKYIEVEPLDNMDYFLEDKTVVIKDEVVYEIIEKAYERQLENYYYDDDNDYYNAVTVGIKQDGTVFYRRVYLRKNEMNNLETAYIWALSNNNKKITLPDLKRDIDVSIDLNGLTDNQIKLIYEMLSDEVKDMTYRDVFLQDNTSAIFDVDVYNYDDYRTWRHLSIPVSDATPETKAFAMELLRDNAKEYEGQYVYDYESNKDKISGFDANIIIINEKGSSSYYISGGSHSGNAWSDIDTEKLEKIGEVLKSTDGENIVIISGSWDINDGRNVYSEYIDGIFRADDEVVQSLIENAKRIDE